MIPPTPAHPLLAPRARATQSGTGTDIPTSTVAAIGGGFVGFALSVLFALFVARAGRVYRDSRRRRAAGEDITFRTLWNRAGGFWGFMVGYGSQAGNWVVGAGGRRDLERWTLWNDWRMWEGVREEKEVVEPGFWEVEVEAKGKGGARAVGEMEAEEMSWDGAKPLSVNTRPRVDGSIDPILDLNLLILMPSSSSAGESRSGEEEYDDLPEMVMGTTALIPMIEPTVTSDALDHPDPGDPLASKSKALKTGDIEHLEHLSPRRAQWRKHSNRWVIEGLGD